METLTGGCLCGGVRYEVVGEPVRFYHCHCSRCRKASGTGHASNLFVKGELRWLSGADQIHTFAHPEAQRFANTFCTVCGGRVPRQVPTHVFIPAGSLDTEPSIRPQARIFSGSRASWSCDGSDVPAFDALPS
ncbi:MAG: GFA family protein [Alphaproteobacteria bacterium]|nr:GFA family protein [Alphaproteobacteria bacterium]